jgi:signal transduction histidine kinase
VKNANSRIAESSRFRIRLWLALITPPSAFDPVEEEKRFLAEYRAVGRIFAIYAYCLGIALALSSYVLLRMELVDVLPIDPISQTLRQCIALVLGIFVVMLFVARTFSLKRYLFVVGLPLAFAVWSLGIMALRAAILYPEYANKLLVALVIATWLSYSFTRLPVVVNLMICGLAGALTYLASTISEPGIRYGVLMYVVVANLVGWISCIQIERRERRVFSQTTELSRLGGRLQSQIVEIQAANAVKNRVLHAVAHDLRQPVASLGIYVSRLRFEERKSTAQSRESTFRSIEACVSMMHSGIEELLSKNDRSSTALELERIDLLGVVREVVDLVEAQAAIQYVEIRTLIRPGKRKCALSNRDALRSVCLNLLVNAIKFQKRESKAKKRVLIAVIETSQSLRIEFVDSGAGIADEEMPHIFKPYWRSLANSRIAAPGLGLGLSIVSDVIDRLPGHSIDVVSRVGRGTRVRLRLPKG